MSTAEPTMTHAAILTDLQRYLSARRLLDDPFGYLETLESRLLAANTRLDTVELAAGPSGPQGDEQRDVVPEVTPPAPRWLEVTNAWDPTPTASEFCECERWRCGIRRCPVHGTTKPPRVWAMPPEPGPDVTRVRDTYGQCFERADAIDEHGSVPVWVGDTFTDWLDIPDLCLSWKQLMEHHAPLTEVDGSQT